jgi:hypothetical protein
VTPPRLGGSAGSVRMYFLALPLLIFGARCPLRRLARFASSWFLLWWSLNGVKYQKIMLSSSDIKEFRPRTANSRIFLRATDRSDRSRNVQDISFNLPKSYLSWGTCDVETRNDDERRHTTTKQSFNPRQC